jgi:restriction endonuclease S subunit
MMCDLEVDKYADISKNELSTFKLNNDDVLFNRTNSFEWVGRTGIYKKIDSRDFIFASYLVRFMPNKKDILPEYLATFLNTKQGVLDIKRRARQSINQTNVNPEEVKEIHIPLLSMQIQEFIKNCFDKAHIARINAKTTYTAAENILLAEIGLTDFTPSNDPVNIKTFSESFATSGRLDAEYYQRKYEQVIEKITAQPHDTLENIVTIQKSIEPGSAHYAEEGLPFYRVADYSKFGVTTPNKYLSSDFVKENAAQLAKLQPKKGSILFAKDGSVGEAYHLTEDINGITSGAILHLRVKDETLVLPEYLTLALNSKLVQMQAERDAGGSIILHWRVSEIENVVVPIIPLPKQSEIAALITQSFALKKQSEHLLEVAKRAVEIAIEQDEAVAMGWIAAHALSA